MNINDSNSKFNTKGHIRATNLFSYQDLKYIVFVFVCVTITIDSSELSIYFIIEQNL